MFGVHPGQEQKPPDGMLHRVVEPASAESIKAMIHCRHGLRIILLLFLVVALLHERGPGSGTAQPVNAHGLIHIPRPATVCRKKLQRDIRNRCMVVKVRQCVDHLPVKHQ